MHTAHILQIVIALAAIAGFIFVCFRKMQRPGMSTASLEALANQGDAKAQCDLAGKYYEGEEVPQDHAKAMEWFRKAAAQGDSWAQFTIGNMYYEGEGVPKDQAEAVKWYLKAAEQGEEEAQSELGDMYYQGQGVAQDYAEALKWFRKAADQGDVVAQGNLAAMYKSGTGTPQNLEEAYFWFGVVSRDASTLDENLKEMQDEFIQGRAEDAAISQRLTPEQLAAIEKRVKEWSPAVKADKDKT